MVLKIIRVVYEHFNVRTSMTGIYVLVRWTANRYVALHSCDNGCQPCALPSVKKTTNTACRGLYTPFFLRSKGWEQRGPPRVRNLHTIAYQLVDNMWTGTKAELERQCQISDSCTWKRRIMSTPQHRVSIVHSVKVARTLQRTSP